MTLTTDYSAFGNENMIALSYKKLAEDVVPGAQILIGDGSIVLEVISCDIATGRCKRCAQTRRRSGRERM